MQQVQAASEIAKRKSEIGREKDLNVLQFCVWFFLHLFYLEFVYLLD